MPLRVNLADVEGDAFEPIPAGRYPLRVFEGEIRTSESATAKHPGSEYIAWEFLVENGEYEGRHLWANTMLSHGDCDCGDLDTFNKSLFSLKNLLAATGNWTPEELDADDFGFEIDDVIGSLVMGTVTVRKSEEYGDGNNIKRFKELDEAAIGSSSALP